MKKKSLSYFERPLKKVYSLAFKRKVVREVESGALSKDGAKRKYDIGGNTTVLNWCRKYGTLQKKDYEIMVTEKGEREADKKRIRDLEKALADAQLKIYAQEVLIDVAERELGIDIRKKSVTKHLKK